MRSRFEEWASTGDRRGPPLTRDTRGWYVDVCVFAWWQAWCAAHGYEFTELDRNAVLVSNGDGTEWHWEQVN